MPLGVIQSFSALDQYLKMSIVSLPSIVAQRSPEKFWIMMSKFNLTGHACPFIKCVN